MLSLTRAKERADKAIQTIQDTAEIQTAKGQLKFLQLDLNDLESVKASAAAFASQESKLDVLWNNAGTGGMKVEVGARTAQGFESMMGMHCVATLLFTELLRPRLQAAVAASQHAPGSVRVVWTSSIAAESGDVPQNGIDFSLLEPGTPNRVRNYAVSKTASWMLAREMARRYAKDGIVSVAQNPGNIKTASYDGVPAAIMFFMNRILKDPKLGGYTELFAGLSPEITLEKNGSYIIPWGRIRPDAESPRQDIIKAMTPEAEGGLGYDTKLWNWCEQQWKPFL